MNQGGNGVYVVDFSAALPQVEAPLGVHHNSYSYLRCDELEVLLIPVGEQKVGLIKDEHLKPGLRGAMGYQRESAHRRKEGEMRKVKSG